MTTPDRPTSRPPSNGGPPRPAQPAAANRPPTAGGAGAEDLGLDADSIYSYGLDGFTPGDETFGTGDPQDSIDIEGLAERVYQLLLREAYIERERLGAAR